MSSGRVEGNNLVRVYDVGDVAVKGGLVGGLRSQASSRLVFDVGHLGPQERNAASNLDKTGDNAPSLRSRKLHKLLSLYEVRHFTLAARYYSVNQVEFYLQIIYYYYY